MYKRQLLDEATDDRALLAVDTRLDARVVADGHEAGLDRADRPVGILADEDIAVVDIHAHHLAGRAHHALGDKIAHRPYHACLLYTS